MVFTRKRQAEDDAAQVNKIEEACATAASLSTSTNGLCPNDTAVKPTAQSGGLASADASMNSVTAARDWKNNGDTPATPMTTKKARRLRKTPAKGTYSRQQIKVERDEKGDTAGVKEAPTSKTDGKGQSKRRKTNKTNVTEQDTADDTDYTPNVASTMSRKFQISSRILRRRRPAPVVRTHGMVTLGISPRAYASKLRRINKKELAKARRLQPDSNRFKFTFGRSELAYHPWPRQVDVNNVARILEEERPWLLAQISQNNATTPMHAGQNFNVDAIVRVMLSQSNTNEAALDAQQSMIYAYPYTVNGVKVIGTIPNYHLMRVQSVEKLKLVLTKGGLQKTKGDAIKKLLDDIYSHNISLLGPGEVAYRFNDPNAYDFVPGLLSLDYLSVIYATRGKQAVFDHLVNFGQIGTKSACCIMAFRMGIPVFAVDTHVAGMAKLLGWVPQDATENEMCSHLDSVIVDDRQKVDLHQDFWRHRRACDKCNGKSQPGSWNYKNIICPLEHLITRPPPRRSFDHPSGREPQRPRPRTVKKVDEDALRAQGMIEVTYQVDDDFDALTSAITMRTAWIHDHSMLEADVQMMEEGIEEIEEIEMRSQVPGSLRDTN